ncbi:hypothetical protein PMAYCL1PPCAC_01293, partial [Pristionchus mayeri]
SHVLLFSKKREYTDWRVNDLSSPNRERKIQVSHRRCTTHIKFVIDGKLYCINEAKEHSTVRAINLSNFDVEPVLSLRKLDLEDLFETTIAHDKKAYFWNNEEQFFYEGVAPRSYGKQSFPSNIN